MTLGGLTDFPEGSAVRLACRWAGRDVALLLVRRGTLVWAYEDLCPHQFLPLTFRGSKVLSSDGERLRCSSHGAEFAVDDGRCVSGPCAGAKLNRVAIRVTSDERLEIEETGQEETS